MLTFLPYEDFAACAKCLDNQRLLKQVIEAWQIESVVLGAQNRWRHSIGVQMWIDPKCPQRYLHTIQAYRNACIRELRTRRTKSGGEFQLKAACFQLADVAESGYPIPPFLGVPFFHELQQANLLRKLPDHYGAYGWNVKPALGYAWWSFEQNGFIKVIPPSPNGKTGKGSVSKKRRHVLLSNDGTELRDLDEEKKQKKQRKTKKTKNEEDDDEAQETEEVDEKQMREETPQKKKKNTQKRGRKKQAAEEKEQSEQETEIVSEQNQAARKSTKRVRSVRMRTAKEETEKKDGNEQEHTHVEHAVIRAEQGRRVTRASTRALSSGAIVVCSSASSTTIRTKRKVKKSEHTEQEDGRASTTAKVEEENTMSSCEAAEGGVEERNSEVGSEVKKSVAQNYEESVSVCSLRPMLEAAEGVTCFTGSVTEAEAGNIDEVETEKHDAVMTVQAATLIEKSKEEVKAGVERAKRQSLKRKSAELADNESSIAAGAMHTRRRLAL